MVSVVVVQLVALVLDLSLCCSKMGIQSGRWEEWHKAVTIIVFISAENLLRDEYL